MGIFSGLYNSLAYAPELKKRADELKESSYIPPSLNSALNNAQVQSSATRYAGQGQDESNIERTAANEVSNLQRSSTSGTNVINGAAGIYGNANNKYAQVRAKGAQIRFQNQGVTNNLLLQKAQKEQNNRNQFLATKSALLGARDQAKASLFQGIDNTITDAAKIAGSIYGIPGGGGGRRSSAVPEDTYTNGWS